MILADYLSRHCNEDKDPSDLIPVSFCRLRDIETFCVGTRASMKARGEMVPEVHGIEKELDPHLKPEQQYLSKGMTLKGAKPKGLLRTPVKDSTHKEGLEGKIDPVRIMHSKANTDIDSNNLTQCSRRTLQRSPRSSVLQPKSISNRSLSKRG